jgi:hypothetical protein
MTKKEQRHPENRGRRMGFRIRRLARNGGRQTMAIGGGSTTKVKFGCPLAKAAEPMVGHTGTFRENVVDTGMYIRGAEYDNLTM